MAVWERLAPACQGCIQPLTCMSPTRKFPSFADRQLCHKSFWWHKSLPSPSSQGQCKEERGRRVGSCALAWQRQAGRRRGAVSRVWAGWGGRRENTPERVREDRIAPRSSSQERRARSGWRGTGRETAEGVQRVKSSQLPFSIRFCFASSEFRHLHNTLSFKNNVGVPDIELCKQVCSQLSEEPLLPPLA